MIIAIVIPCLSSAHVTEQTKNTLRQLHHLGADISVREACSDLPMSRSVITFELLQRADAVLWLDADVTARTPETLWRWAQANCHEHQLSVALYPRKGGNIWAGHGVPSPMPAVPFEVESAGAGCMMIPKSVAKQVGSKLPDLVDQHDRWYKPIFHKILRPPQELSEDISFCWRCANEGIPIIADPSVDLGHVRSGGKVVDWASELREALDGRQKVPAEQKGIRQWQN